ncbi:MAG TPA: hypothetical protein VE977_13925 [Pyrinomonadaceae bacterium]|nr:hypothetical protein [Pyrinomonadaceae bacterium]
MRARLVRKGFINTAHRVEFGMMTPRFITIKGIDEKELTTMKKPLVWTAVAVFGLLSVMTSVAVRQADARGNTRKDFVAPIIFQAAGPTIASIQSSVDGFRAALGAPNNGNAAGPLAGGRREINWDGGGSAATAVVPTPFTGFLNRGALFTTPGTGFVQAPLSGVATTFGNPTYEAILQAFSPVRLFSAIGSNITEVDFSVPGSPNMSATTTGFGAVFSDVDQPGGSKKGKRGASSLIEYFGVDGELLFTSFVPASPGDGSLSFVGVVFADARIARVRITSGDAAPGPDDDSKLDIVMMDDFLYGEPRPLP